MRIQTAAVILTAGVLISALQAQDTKSIDAYISKELKAQNVAPSPLCSDSEFVRRIYLDVCGAIPSAGEVRQFLSDTSTDKRAKLIDKLLQNERYADHWETMWGDWLREHSYSKRKEGTVQGSYRTWIRETLEKNTPYDEFARKLITAKGTAEENGAANFYFRDQQNRVETVNAVSQVFMGTRMACAQCHDHPFDKWTQQDFHNLMAFFARVEVTKVKKKETEGSQVFETASGEYHMPADGDAAMKKKKNKDGEVVEPVFPWNPSETVVGSGSRREALADFVIGTRQFASVQVNRLWAQLMGRGIVDPCDDFRPNNPPSHPDLLEYLTDEFIHSKFDNKHVLRLMLNSATYQASSQPSDNESDKRWYSHQQLRHMTAEELFDSILMATGYDKGLKGEAQLVADTTVATKQKGVGKVKKHDQVEWAADLPTPAANGSFMNLFNQPRRDVIMVKRDDSGSIPQALELLNGREITDAIKNSPLAQELLDSKATPTQIVTELYLSTLSRFPSTEEVKIVSANLKPTREAIEDLEWALLNSREFVFVK
jgi:hypothetical protein